MAIHAYSYDYLAGAQKVLGDAVDFSVLSLDVEPNAFGKALAVSDSAKQFATGNPKYVAGMNGCEFAKRVLLETKTPFTDAEDVMYLDKGSEFWAGWALAFYQWHSSFSFMEILNAISLEEIIHLYPTYHEMDVMQFVDLMKKKMDEAYPKTRLRIRRELCDLSQTELAAEAEVSIRQIQLFEQRQRDINKTAADTLRRLGRALHCKMEDLMEL